MTYRSTADFDDEEFGFRCKRIIRPPLASLTNPFDYGYDDDNNNDDDDINPLDTHINSKINHKKTNDEYDRKPATSQISKGKGVTFERKLQWHTPERPNTLALSPISPFTPPDKQQQPSRSFINVNTLSPELTGPQTAISPYKSNTTQSAHDTNLFSTSVISDDSFTNKVKVPPSSVSTSEYYTMIKSDLPHMEQIRQLVLMLLQQILEQQPSILNVAGDDDKALQAKLTRKNNVQWVFQEVIKKLSNREVNPFGNRLMDDSVFTYATPSPKNDEHLKKIEGYKRIYYELEKESKDRQQAFNFIYEYNAQAEDLRDTIYAGPTINLGSCYNYVDSMDEDQRTFIGDYQQWKEENSERLFNNDNDGDGDDTSITSTVTSTTSLRDLMLRKSRVVTELRQQLNFANERQKLAGEVGDQLLADLSAKLKQKTLCFPVIDKPMEDIDYTSSQSDQPPSSIATTTTTPSPRSSTSSHTDTTDTENLVRRMKKRRLLGLQDDIEMYGKPNFELFQAMSKFK